MKKLLSFIFVFLALNVFAASPNNTQSTITVTNNPTATNAQTLTLQGITYTWTNLSGIYLLSATNDSKNATTNLYNTLTNDFRASLLFSWASPTSFIAKTYLGSLMTGTNAGGWATTIFGTNTPAPGNITASNIYANGVSLNGDLRTAWPVGSSPTNLIQGSNVIITLTSGTQVVASAVSRSEMDNIESWTNTVAGTNLAANQLTNNPAVKALATNAVNGFTNTAVQQATGAIALASAAFVSTNTIQGQTTNNPAVKALATNAFNALVGSAGLSNANAFVRTTNGVSANLTNHGVFTSDSGSFAGGFLTLTTGGAGGVVSGASGLRLDGADPSSTNYWHGADAGSGAGQVINIAAGGSGDGGVSSALTLFGANTTNGYAKVRGDIDISGIAYVRSELEVTGGASFDVGSVSTDGAGNLTVGQTATINKKLLLGPVNLATVEHDNPGIIIDSLGEVYALVFNATLTNSDTVSPSMLTADATSLAFGDQEPSGDRTLISSTGGSLSHAYIDGSGTNDASGQGSLAGGKIDISTIRASGNGAFAHGWTDSGPGLLASGDGSFVTGYAEIATIIANNPGAFAGGYAVSSQIRSEGNGSYAFGYAASGNIRSAGLGAIAMGTGPIAATDDNAWAIGTGFTNNIAGSWAVGFGTRPTLHVTVNGVTNAGTLEVTGTITGNGSGLTNLNAAKLTGGPITNAISYNAITQTNFVLNQLYTNGALYNIIVSGNAKLVEAAATVGAASLGLFVLPTARVAGPSQATIVTGLLGTNTLDFSTTLATNTVYWLSNDSSGVGNAGSLNAGTGKITPIR